MRTRAHARRGVLAAAAAGAASACAAACVRVDPAPNGVASARLDPAPPSVALGDVLRDSAGAPYRVHGVAYDAAGKVVPTAAFRYAYVPFTPDTAAGAVVDTALVVDSATGAVRATGTWLTSGSGVGISVGRVVARIGAAIQIADTIQIVPPPTALAVTDTAITLRYDCTDDRTTLVQRSATEPDTVLVNAAGPFTLVVRGDSAGTTVGVRRWLVRWSIDTVTVPNPIPTVTLASGAKVPAIAVASAADALLAYDTTATTGTPGTSSILLRIRPTALGPAFSADSLFDVTLRADVIVGAGQAVPGSPVRNAFTVHMRRSSHPVVPNVASCPR